MVEEYFVGEEETLTIMPLSPEGPEYWSMLPVSRFNYIDGISP
jgi:hypothetical protein